LTSLSTQIRQDVFSRKVDIPVNQ